MKQPGTRCFGFYTWLALLVLLTRMQSYAQAPEAGIHIERDSAPTLRFEGSRSAELFSRELDESLRGALSHNFVARADEKFPAGFINASLPGFPWAGTMWTRDGGTFMRELVMRGYLEHASLLAECLMSLVEKNGEGYYAFPEYFRGRQHAAGAELDGTASIVIGMVLLWQRLPEGNPTKSHIQRFLFQSASPVEYFGFLLQHQPLLAGSGEFGCGGSFKRTCDNVVQNNLARLALLATASMAVSLGKNERATQYRHLAEVIRLGMGEHLVAVDGSWIWCIDPVTLRPVPEILNAPENLGVGSQNGVLTMDADVFGFLPENDSWPGLDQSRKTFERLYETPLRKTEFDHYGIWTQFDLLAGGMLTSPSYGQGYSLQAMLLLDKLEMAEQALKWLALETYSPIPEYKLHRTSKYYFYERMYSPDAVGKVELAEGCGALNLVNVSEPLKVSRLMLGVDDSSRNQVRIVPRLPAGWTSVEAHDWPIWTAGRLVRAEIHYDQYPDGTRLTLRLRPGEHISDLMVRMPSEYGYQWIERKNVEVAQITLRGNGTPSLRNNIE